jgi:L-ribulose-5-phosphate 4-epimerase
MSEDGARTAGAADPAPQGQGPLDEGTVKFHGDHRPGPPPAAELVAAIEPFRARLHALGLVGVYPNGIGYGNLSVRAGAGFVITGTGTGALGRLTAAHYTRVVDSDEVRNRVESCGPVRASSESMTHAVIYRTVPEASAVAHVHHPQLWRRACGAVPTTAADVAYGTPAMASEVRRLLAEPQVREGRVLAMAGHEEGLVAFGENMERAVDRLFALAAELSVRLGGAPR